MQNTPKYLLVFILIIKNYHPSSRIIGFHRGTLLLRYPNKSIFDEEMENMSSKNNNQLNIPEAREAMDQFKMEAARDEDVSAAY